MVWVHSVCLFKVNYTFGFGFKIFYTELCKPNSEITDYFKILVN
jgi:hypothetical protein